jgi:hypothetical protein
MSLTLGGTAQTASGLSLRARLSPMPPRDPERESLCPGGGDPAGAPIFSVPRPLIRERRFLMTREGSGAQFAIKLDGMVRTYRDFRETAIEAARFLQMLNPSAKIAITDLRDGSSVPFERQ